MKKTPDVFIVDVSPPESFAASHFTGAVNIPQNQLVSRMNEIPENRPLVIHCRFGKTCMRAYPVVKNMRPDIPEISYIDGEPLFTEYNHWLRTKK